MESTQLAHSRVHLVPFPVELSNCVTFLHSEQCMIPKAFEYIVGANVPEN